MSGTGSQFGRNVFVLDVSQSMKGVKTESLLLSVTRIIEDIPDKSYVGIVSFSEKAYMTHKVVQITDRTVRNGLIKSVRPIIKRRTNIGAGILGGVRALKQSGVSTDGAVMFLVTDGKDITGTDYVSGVLPTLLEAKVFIVSYFEIVLNRSHSFLR